MAEPTPVQSRREEARRARLTRPAGLAQTALLVALVLTPLLIPSFRVMDLAAKIMIFAVAVAAYDLIIGYTGIISFAHAMFFGLGAYCLALPIYHFGPPTWLHFPLALVLAVVLSVILSLVIAFFSLRVKAIFFAMMTLALAEFGHILGYQWTDLTRGEDGLSFKLPGLLDVGFSAGSFLGVEISGRLLTYYLILIVAALLFVGLVRFVNSPVGRVLQAIRDNEARATALGYQTFHYKVLAAVFGHTVAALAGVLFAMWLRFVNPDSVLGTGLMLSILLMVIIGGLGTTYGAIVGAAFIKLTETWLPDLQAVAKALAPGAELLQRLAERWILYFGVLFILVVFFFPKGIIGTIRERARLRAATATEPKD